MPGISYSRVDEVKNIKPQVDLETLGEKGKELQENSWKFS